MRSLDCIWAVPNLSLSPDTMPTSGRLQTQAWRNEGTSCIHDENFFGPLRRSSETLRDLHLAMSCQSMSLVRSRISPTLLGAWTSRLAALIRNCVATLTAVLTVEWRLLFAPWCHRSPVVMPSARFRLRAPSVRSMPHGQLQNARSPPQNA